MKGHTLFQEEIITKWQKYIDAILKYSAKPLGQFQPNLLLRRDNYKNSENTLIKFKNLLRNHWTQFIQTCHKAFLGEWDRFETKKDHIILKKTIMLGLTIDSGKSVY